MNLIQIYLNICTPRTQVSTSGVSSESNTGRGQEYYSQKKLLTPIVAEHNQTKVFLNHTFSCF